MPQIFSISGSFFGSSSWTNPAIWYGGVVPTASDQVFIRGIRTTVNFAAGYIPWSGVQTITVASTAGFPTSSSFYTYTDRDEEIKINYVTCSATQFISASIDTSFYSWSLDIFPLTQSLPSKKGGIIANGSFVHFRPGQILITASMNISASNSSSGVGAITIENGGDLKMTNNSTMSLNGFLTLNDGAFEISESALVKWDKNFPSQSTETGVFVNWTGISVNGQPLQKLIIRGPETRFNSYLISSSAIGDSYITVENGSGFAVGDHIFVGEPYLTQSKGDNGFRSAFVSEVSSYDEVFEVAGTDPVNRRLYVQRMNGLNGIVKATSSATELIVDEERFQVGDKVVINNQVRTITAVSSFDFLLKDYNFSGSSTLAEWETDLTRSFSFSDFTLYPGLGLTQFTTTQYRHLFVKDIMLDNVKVEAYVSNLRNITAGSGSRAEFGVHIQSEPQADSDFGAPTSYNCPFRTSLALDPANSRLFLRQKFYNNTNFNTIFTSSFSPDGPKKLTLETSNGMVRGYLNDIPVFDEVMRAGNSWGRVGLYTNGNNCFVCTRFTVYAKYEKITLDSGVTVNIGDTVYETGIEYPHRVNDRVIKLASVVTNPLEHRDLAFAYRGAEEYNYGITGSFPYIYANNSASKNTDINNVARQVNDYFASYALGTANSRSVIIDFGQRTTFNNVGFVDSLAFNLQNFTSSVNGGISFSGSNGITGSLLSPTASFWVPITGTLDERFRVSSETFRSFTFPSQSFRFLRIETQGITRGDLRNTFNGYRVRQNISNSLAVNNASDLGIGDEIFIFTKNNISSQRDLTNYLPVIALTSSLTTASFVDRITQHYTIVNKSSSVLFLDRPFEEGNVEAGALVVKMNRSLKFSGSLASGSGNWKVGKFTVAGGGTTYAVRRILIENVSFQHLNVNYPYVGAGANQIYNGFALQDANWFNYMGLLQGCTFYNCYNYGGSSWFFGGRSGYATRNCVLTSMLGVSLAGNSPSTTAPIIATGNMIYVQTQTGSFNQASTNVYSYNYVFGGDMPIPSFTGYNSLYVAPYAGAYVYERNYIAGAQSQVNYQQSIDNFGTSALLKVRFNKFEYWNGTQGRFYINQFLDKGMDSPIILSKRGGLDGKRVHTANPGNVQYHSYISSSYAGNAIPAHNILGYIKNHNKQGYDIYPAYTGWWVKPQNSPYYRWYRHNTNANDWRNPILAAQIWVQPNVTGSFTINFDYFVNQQIVWQLDGQYSGSLYFIAMKNGNELEPLANNILPKSTTPQNFNKTYQLSGSGHYYFALAGNATMGGYAAIANISSRLIAPDTNDIQVLTNTFNLRYFNNEESVLAKSSYNQTPTDTKFRLQGARIF